MSTVPFHPEQTSSANRSATRLIERFHQLQSRSMWIGLGRAALTGVAVFVVTMLLAAWLDVVFRLSPASRSGAWWVAFLVAAGVGFWVYRSAQKAATANRLASKIDQEAGTFGQVRSGMELTDYRHPSGDTSPLTQQMAEIAVHRASKIANGIWSEQVVPVRPVVMAGLQLVAVFFVTLVLMMVAPAMASTEFARFWDPNGDHPPYSPYQFEISTSPSELLYGEELVITAKIDGPMVERVQLVLVPPAEQRDLSLEETESLDELPMFPTPDGTWQATVAAVKEEFDFYLKVHNGRSEVMAVDLIQTPQIEDIQVHIRHPEYTKLQDYKGPVPNDGLQGLPGTQFQLTLTSNRPLQVAEMTFEGDENHYQTTMPADGNTVQGSFELSTSGSLWIAVVDIDGTFAQESIVIPVTQLEDDSPLVRLTKPQKISFATPTAIIPVQVQAEDDYGLKRCEIYRSLNHSRFLPLELPLSSEQPTRAMPQTVLPVKDYDLQPGDEIRLFARVEDNDPNGPDAPIGKGAESGIVSIRIISEAQYQASQKQQIGMQTLMNRYLQAQRRLERLASELEDLQKQLEDVDPDSEAAEEIREKIQKLAEQMKEDAKALEQMADAPLPLKMDEELSPQLREMAKRLNQMASELSEAAKSGATNQQLKEQLQKQQDAIKKEQGRHQQEAMQPLEYLNKILPLKRAESEFTQLVQRQRSLADRLQSLKDLPGEPNLEQRARIRELEEEQNQLREQLTDLVNRIEEQAELLPDEERFEELKQSALDFADAVRASGATNLMGSAEERLADRDTNEGHRLADEAATALEALLSQCNGMGSSCNSCAMKFSPGMGSSMGQTMNQLCPKPGSRMGGVGVGMGGSGGMSSTMSSMPDVGMYGSQPMMPPSQGMTDKPENSLAAGNYVGSAGGTDDTASAGYSASQQSGVTASSDWAVPSRYRRQAGRYLQKLADELDE